MEGFFEEERGATRSSMGVDGAGESLEDDDDDEACGIEGTGGTTEETPEESLGRALLERLRKKRGDLEID